MTIGSIANPVLGSKVGPAFCFLMILALLYAVRSVWWSAGSRCITSTSSPCSRYVSAISSAASLKPSSTTWLWVLNVSTISSLNVARLSMNASIHPNLSQMVSARSWPMPERRNVMRVERVMIMKMLSSKTLNWFASLAMISENSDTWLMTWPMRNEVRPSSPDASPSPHIIMGQTKTVSSAMRTAIGAALLSASPDSSRSMPSMKKKRMMPNTLSGSACCSI
mmetsp:Transcript_11023/g.25816  ORF Transcript_11023/g.25816 Transcript_11023/m.25816 type:complete len:223 (+) Transcript_11023:60-728(+)